MTMSCHVHAKEAVTVAEHTPESTLWIYCHHGNTVQHEQFIKCSRHVQYAFLSRAGWHIHYIHS